MARGKRRRRPYKLLLERWTRQLARVSEAPLPLIATTIAALLLLIALILIYLFVPSSRSGFWSGVFFAATGFFFDLMFFGVILALIIYRWDRKQEGRRYQDQIQDFKHWDSEEGRLRIAGAIRRLERIGITAVDFRGIRLSDFSFRRNDIRAIRGAIFYDGEWGTMSSHETVDLKNVDFGFIDCSGVTFSSSNPFLGLSALAPPVRITDCWFCEANLRDALFRGAVLEWTEKPPDKIYEEVKNPDGSIGLIQIFYPSFDGANLSGASFANTQFHNADFRRAENILEADFSGASGLESCVFDTVTIKEAVQKKAGEENR